MKIIFICLLSALLIMTVCAGCQSTPPTVEAVEQRFTENYADILTIVSFMVNSGHEDIYIKDCSGKMYVDFEWINIADSSVNASIDNLLGAGLYQRIDKSGNTICFEQWDGLQDIGCGIAYSINGNDPPEVQFMTELVPLSQDGWYYYVDDYNLWRIQSK